MAYEIEHDAFRERRLTLERAWVLGPVYLAVDGRKVVDDTDVVKDVEGDDGERAGVALVDRGVQPVPNVNIDGREIEIAEPLAWYEWLWAALPFLLVAYGGAFGFLLGPLNGLGIATGGFLGGAIATPTFFLNCRILRAGLGAVAAFLLSGLVTAIPILAIHYLRLVFEAGTAGAGV